MEKSVAVRNAELNALETAIGTSPVLQIRTGATLPATEGSASTGTLLCTMTLPSNWMADASGGTKALAGSWTGSAVADGTPGHYELFASNGTTRHLAGTCGGPGSGAELVLDASTVEEDQVLTIATWVHTAGNAW